MHSLVRALGDLDARYAQAISDRFKLSDKPTIGNQMQALTSAVPVREIFNRPGNNPEGVREHLISAAYEGGLAATNIGARYALPAGGVTAAGVGLYELTQALTPDQQSPGTVMPY